MPEVAIQTTSVFTTSGDVKTCPGWFTHGRCGNGHEFVKLIYCGREWCPICGAKKSAAHMRRVAGWLPKAQQLSSISYLIFTIPVSERYRFRNKRVLSDTMRRMMNGYKSRRHPIPGKMEELGFKRGLARWHWFGDKSTRWNPHLNMLVESGYIKPALLQEIKDAWAEVIGVPIEKNNVRCRYYSTRGAIFHRLKYITRATFLDYEWDPTMSEELYRFRNTRSWGEWNGTPAWHLEHGHDKLETIAKFEKGICPIPGCKQKIDWSPVIPVEILKQRQLLLQPISSGYFHLNST